MKIGRQGDGGGHKPIVLSGKQIAEVETLSAVLSMAQVAEYFGIIPDTFAQIRKRQPEVDLAYKKGKSKAINMAGNKLLSKVRRGNLGAICFYLKTQAGYRETNRTELTGADGGPIETNNNILSKIDLSDVSDEELVLLERLGMNMKKRENA